MADHTDASDTQNWLDSVIVLEKAKFLVTLDQINLIRSLLPVPLPAITPAQALNAVRVKANVLS